ncbi:MULTISPECIES: hypothetical protein [unclassified Streptomyces]|nr:MULTISPECIES: hypothetical protein [unclassified Streptomyces]
MAAGRQALTESQVHRVEDFAVDASFQARLIDSQSIKTSTTVP